jgi:hypothetical protein
MESHAFDHMLSGQEQEGEEEEKEFEEEEEDEKVSFGGNRSSAQYFTYNKYEK